MRVYILSTTKYFITAFILMYTLLSFLHIRTKKESVKLLLETFQLFLMIGFLTTSFITLGVARGNQRYIIFGGMVLLMISGAVILFRILYPQADNLLFNNVCLLISMGLVILTRLSTDAAVRQAVIASGGILIALFLPMLRSRFRYLKKPAYFYATAGIIALAVVLLLGTTTNGSYITFSVFGVTFQPSEFVKLLFVFFLASTLSDAQTGKEYFMVSLMALLHVLVLVASRDLGSAVIFYVVFVLMLFIATGKYRVLFLGTAAGGIGAVSSYFLFSHVQVRFQAFRDPWSVIDSIGYQIGQSLFAIGYGGPFGAGLTQGASYMIPFVESDFIFAAIAEEMGLIAAICLILLCLNCFIIIIRISLDYSDKFLQLFAFGIAVTYLFQTFLTIGGETKFIPLTGVTLPLVSYGGSSILATILMFAFVQILYMLQKEQVEAFEQRYRKEKAEAFEARYRAEQKAEREKRENIRRQT
ncbi:MAG: FtsW/RodA/SpoVE family cell cycle protein, partial [Lachnospiraceae bacterium]|nr:FtsW/RodA/SpoVE family cell cycle protein [Lachnospiraceae bacterium]